MGLVLAVVLRGHAGVYVGTNGFAVVGPLLLPRPDYGLQVRGPCESGAFFSVSTSPRFVCTNKWVYGFSQNFLFARSLIF